MPTELVAFLGWLASAAGVGVIKSEFLEHEKWFQTDPATGQPRSDQWKSRITLILTIILTVGSYLLIKYVVPLFNEEWLTLITLILTPISIYIGGQKWHDEQHKPVVETTIDISAKTETPVGTSNTTVQGSSTGTSSPGQGQLGG